MRSRSSIVLTCTSSIVALAVFLPALVRAQVEYPNPPEALKVKVEEAVTDVLNERDPDELEAGWHTIVVDTVLDAVSPGVTTLTSPSEPGEARNLLRLDTEVAETARFDKQIGATSTTTGTTSLVAKAGISRLLAAAIEHGAIQQKEEGTSLTLSTTPYALGIFATGAEDTADLYNRWWPAPQIAIAANFALDSSKDSAAGAADANFDNLTTLSAKWQFLGDRSPRSTWFQKQWEDHVFPAVKADLKNNGAALDEALNGDPQLQELSDQLQEKWKKNLQKELTALGRKPPTHELQDRLVQQILADMWVEVHNRYTTCSTDVAAMCERLRGLAVDLNASSAALREARTKFFEVVKESNAKPIGSIQYIDHRVDNGTDYSEVKFILEAGVAAFDLAMNAELSLNHDPDGSKHQDTVRDYGASISLERQFGNVLSGRLSPGDLSPITLAVSGKVSYLEDVNDEMGIAQLRLEVPIYGGLTLPLAASYSSRTEEKDKDEFRVNVGAGLDTDKLMALFKMGALGLAGK